MILYFNALRSNAVRRVSASRFGARRFYVSERIAADSIEGKEVIPKLQSPGDESHPTDVENELEELLEADNEGERAKSFSPGHMGDKTILANRIRALMRKQPHGLAAVVAPSEVLPIPFKTGRPKSPRKTEMPDSKGAMLISSLNTVTMFPVPYISFNCKTPSQTYTHIRDYGSFMLSGLDNPTTAFAFSVNLDRQKKEAQRKDRTKKDQRQESDTTSWAQYIDQKGRVESQWGGTWWMHCKFRSKLSQRVGDHMLIVAEVLEAGSLRDTGLDGYFDGMVYLGGNYRQIGNRMPTIIKHFAGVRNGEDV